MKNFPPNLVAKLTPIVKGKIKEKEGYVIQNPSIRYFYWMELNKYLYYKMQNSIRKAKLEVTYKDENLKRRWTSCRSNPKKEKSENPGKGKFLTFEDPR